MMLAEKRPDPVEVRSREPGSRESVGLQLGKRAVTAFAVRPRKIPLPQGNRSARLHRLAEEIKAKPTLKARVLTEIEAAGNYGITSDYLAVLLAAEGWHVPSVPGTVRSLSGDGVVVSSGRTRPSVMSGRLANTVWVVWRHCPVEE